MNGCFRVIRGMDVVETFPEWAPRQEAEEFADMLNEFSQSETLF